MSPPMTTVAIGRCTSAPVPVASAIGRSRCWRPQRASAPANALHRATDDRRVIGLAVIKPFIDDSERCPAE